MGIDLVVVVPGVGDVEEVLGGQPFIVFERVRGRELGDDSFIFLVFSMIVHVKCG